MTALSPSDIADLDQEIAETREQVMNLSATLARQLAPRHREKIEWQKAAALRHLDRLQKVRQT